MKLTETRLNELVQWIAIKFYGLAGDKMITKNPIETIIDIVGNTLQHNNALLKMTFLEAIILITDHYDDIMHKTVQLAHHHNPSNDCKKCVLFELCAPDEEQQARHLAARTDIDETKKGLEEFIAFLDEMMSNEQEELGIEVAREGKIIPLEKITQISKGDIDRHFETAIVALKKLLQDKKND